MTPVALTIEDRLDRLEKLLDAVHKMMAIDLSSPAPSALLDRIKAAVCRHYRITLKMLVSKSRVEHIVWPRMVAMVLAWELTDLTLQAIGDRLGKKDHGTVRHAIEAVNDRCEVDKDFRASVDSIRAQLKTEPPQESVNPTAPDHQAHQSTPQ